MTLANAPFVSTRFFVPESWVPSSVLETHLTVRPFVRTDEEPRPPIPLYDAESYPGMIGVPIDWGVRTYGHREEIEDHTVQGSVFDPPNRPDPTHERVHDPEAQQAFHDDLLEAMEEEFAVAATAPTGSGKTVVALWVAADLGRSTLVIAPTQQIAKQWRTAAVELLGMDPDDVGVAQGKVCQYNKPLVIGIINSVAGSDYAPEFYHAFGTVIWDEVHRYATQKWHATLFMFPSAYKLALSATLGKRKDKADPVYQLQFGMGQVVSTAQALPVKVHVMSFNTPGAVYGEEDRQVALMCLARDQARNDLLAQIITLLYDNGRTVLAVGESIAHVERIIQLLREADIPEAEIGQFTASHTREDGSRAPTSPEYLDWCRERPAIIVGTYGMWKEGTDVPRLDAGVELTPRADATQLLGRVRRPYEGKTSALWYTILDKKFGMFHGYLKARQKDYRADPQIKVIRHDR
jgi:superfamily II DNA or RNA helicase